MRRDIAMTETRRFRFPWLIWGPAVGGAAVFFATAIVGAAMSPQDTMSVGDWQVQMVLFGGVPISLAGLVGSGLLARRALKRHLIELQVELLLDDRKLLAMTSCGYLCGYQGKGWPVTTGGVLVLTDRELIFRTSPADFWLGEVRLPLHEVHSAETIQIKFSPCGLRVNRIDGPAICFLFSMVGGPEQVDQFAESINLACEQSA